MCRTTGNWLGCSLRHKSCTQHGSSRQRRLLRWQATTSYRLEPSGVFYYRQRAISLVAASLQTTVSDCDISNAVSACDASEPGLSGASLGTPGCIVISVG